MTTETLVWFKSSYSDGEGGECVEVAACALTIHIRDSKNPTGPHLAVAPATWSAFVSGELVGEAR
ncbi:DUF397 domain-containing protein [Streptomyces sp. NPDC001617]